MIQLSRIRGMNRAEREQNKKEGGYAVFSILWSTKRNNNKNCHLFFFYSFEIFSGFMNTHKHISMRKVCIDRQKERVKKFGHTAGRQCSISKWIWPMPDKSPSSVGTTTATSTNVYKICGKWKKGWKKKDSEKTSLDASTRIKCVYIHIYLDTLSRTQLKQLRFFNRKHQLARSYVSSDYCCCWPIQLRCI